MRKIFTAGLILFISINTFSQKISLKDEAYSTLTELTAALIKLQITDHDDANYGALQCPECNVLHTRAAEAVFPFTVIFKQTDDKKYLKAAIDVVNWLIKQQQKEGQWIETPWQWTGTTADQLLMITFSYSILKPYLSEIELTEWNKSIKAAADYLVKYMSPDFASINYCPTSAAVLAEVYKIIPDKTYLEKARTLAHWTVAKMDEAGFIQGEAARSFGVKYGVDLGYEMDMSLWGLAFYARTADDRYIESMVKNSLEKNLYFVYPSGAIDGSWGSRCYKWTTFGSKTADGCQILFSLFAKDDSRYVTAAYKNLVYLRTMIKDGLIGNGPHFWRLFPAQLCNYPTFARAKNLAMTYMFGIQEKSDTPKLPSEKTSWMKYFPTVNVTLARSKNMMMTVSGYGYKDLTSTNNGQYNQHPTGGSICNLWVEGHGLLQTSSQTKYIRGEPVHMPVVKDTSICLTPRIEFTDQNGYFTNLYEFEGRTTTRTNKDTVAYVSTSGELKNEQWMQGGVAYKWSHVLLNNSIEKHVILRFHDRQPIIRIVEPIVEDEGMSFEFLSPQRVIIKGKTKKFMFEITKGDFKIETAEKAERYLFPFPAMKCYPLLIKINPPIGGYEQEVRYKISLLK